MGYPPNWMGGKNPREILMRSSRVLTLPEKTRLWAIREVNYDDNMTPIYASPLVYEDRYTSLAELVKDKRVTPLLLDEPIYDLDNYLSIYNDEEVCTVRQGF